jgi:hypothetical protein
MKILFLIFFLFISFLAFSQNRVPGNKSQVSQKEADSIRTAVMNRELLLSPSEASRFWPLYEVELKEIQSMNHAYFKWVNQQKNQIDKMSDSQLQDFLAKQDDYLLKKLDLRRRYELIYKRIISLKQLAHLYTSEEIYQRQLIQFRIKKGQSQ